MHHVMLYFLHLDILNFFLSFSGDIFLVEQPGLLDGNDFIG